jgi:hypothetical protein
MMEKISMLQAVFIVTGVIVIQMGLSIWVLSEINASVERVGHLPATLSVIYIAFVIFVSVFISIGLWRKDRNKELQQPVPVVPDADENSL